MKKIIRNLMVGVIAAFALTAFTGCPAAPEDPAAPENPAAPETPENPDNSEPGFLETKLPFMIKEFKEDSNLSIEFTKDDTFIFKLYGDEISGTVTEVSSNDKDDYGDVILRELKLDPITNNSEITLDYLLVDVLFNKHLFRIYKCTGDSKPMIAEIQTE